MLASLVLFAAMGGALAFKAKYFNVGYCKGESYIHGLAESSCPEGTFCIEDGTSFFYVEISDKVYHHFVVKVYHPKGGV
jgi:hypothetical protein